MDDNDDNPEVFGCTIHNRQALMLGGSNPPSIATHIIIDGHIISAFIHESGLALSRWNLKGA